ncbi:MAG: Ig-like domain-containing protein [Actinomycetota bacterium]|nr:Ig-like domain-containing protein [Actinomycetota bacterium]
MSAPSHRANAGVPRRAFHSFFGIALISLLFGGQTLAWSAWLSTAPTAAIRQVLAASLAIPGAPVPAQVAGGKTVQLSWATVADATNYEVRYFTTASGGTPSTVCTSTGTTCVDPNSRAGSNNWYSVVARVGSNWIAESARAAYSSDDATAVSITSLGSDTGSSATDFITQMTSNALVGTSEANASIVIKRGVSTIATATANSSGDWTSTSVTLNEGLQDLAATATDAYANTATATKSGIRLDTVAPATSHSATCTTPGNAAPVGNWCKQTTLSMTATFSDAASGLQAGTSQYSNNGGVWTNYTGAVSLAEANGRVVQVRATDIAGNVGTTSVNYYIDGTKPTTTIAYPTNGSSFLTSSALASALNANCGAVKSACGSASDAISGVSTTQYKLQRSGTGISGCMNNSGSWGTCSSLQTSTFVTPNWHIAVNPNTAYPALTALATYTLTARATDAAGNVGTNVISSWTVTLL